MSSLAHTSAINNAVGPVRPAAVAASPSPPPSFVSLPTRHRRRRLTGAARVHVVRKYFRAKTPSAGRTRYTRAHVLLRFYRRRTTVEIFSLATRFYLYSRTKTFDFSLPFIPPFVFHFLDRRPFREVCVEEGRGLLFGRTCPYLRSVRLRKKCLGVVHRF